MKKVPKGFDPNLIFKVTNRHFYSAMLPPDSSARVKYKKGEVTFPVIEGSSLFVFSCLSNAKHFTNNGNKILKGYCKNPRPAMKLLPWWRLVLYVKDDYEKFWLNGWYEEQLMWPPTGSIACDAVFIVGEV